MTDTIQVVIGYGRSAVDAKGARKAKGHGGINRDTASENQDSMWKRGIARLERHEADRGGAHHYRNGLR